MSNARKLIEEMPDDEGRKMAEFCLDGQGCGGDPYDGWSNSATWCFHQYFFQESALVDEWHGLCKAGKLTPERAVQLFDHAQREGRMEAIDDWCEGRVNVAEIISEECKQEEPNPRAKYGSTRITPGDLPQKLESRRIREAKVAPVGALELPGESAQEADALTPKPDAVVKVEVTGTAQSVQKAIAKMAKKGIKKPVVAEAAGSLAPTRAELDAFTRAYIEAMFFTQGNEDEFDGKDIEDIAPETLRRIIADCKKFQEENSELYAGGASRGSGQYSADEQAGHDFWLTRNGHGAGFWDSDWPEEVADKLDAAATSFREAEMYVGDDGLVYQMGAEGERGPGIDSVVVKNDDGGGAGEQEPVYKDSGDEDDDDESETFGESAKQVVDRLLEDEDGEQGLEGSEEGEDDQQAYQDMKAELESGEAATISDNGQVYFGRNRLGQIGHDIADQDAAFAVIKAEAEKQSYYPNVFVVNDHGNVTQYTLDGAFVRDWV